MSMIENVRSFLQLYPPLENERLDVDCLDSDMDSFSIDSVPCERVVKQYLDGSRVCRFLFTLSSRMYYGADIVQQQENLAFFEGLEAWLFQGEMLGRLPALDPGQTARALRVLSSAYPIVIDGDSGTARYQIQCELIYLQEVIL